MTSASAVTTKDYKKAHARKASSSARDGEEDQNDPSSKKRRKVNHACVYCRRSHMTCESDRPCKRCIKRDIGHLCHDEPRYPVRKSKSEPEANVEDEEAPGGHDAAAVQSKLLAFGQNKNQLDADSTLQQPMVPGSQAATDRVELVQPAALAVDENQSLKERSAQMFAPNDPNLHFNNQLQHMHNFHPSYMFNTSEVHNEYNLLNDFLSTSLLDDGALFGSTDANAFLGESSFPNTVGSLAAVNPAVVPDSQPNCQPSSSSQAAVGSTISRPPSRFPLDKAQETYYLTAADPAGADPPEQRMNTLLQAKYDAGLLKPFKYVKGYARLNQYMERNLQPTSRQKILRQLDKFRPKFRERMQSLTDIELVLVEMWFERSLMEYDRVFASMAIPACCWRRTGEIFRGNREMAELIHVPMQNLRDGKIAIHEIIAEDSLVSYWDKFGAIAFDSSQKAILTSCWLKEPNSNSKDSHLRCCFSFTIRRDPHNIPSLIVGNFLPVQAQKRQAE